MKKIVKSLLFVAIVASMAVVGSCGSLTESSGDDVVDTATYETIRCKRVWLADSIPIEGFGMIYGEHTIISGGIGSWINGIHYMPYLVDSLFLIINRRTNDTTFISKLLIDSNISCNYGNITRHINEPNSMCKLVKFERINQ